MLLSWLAKEAVCPARMAGVKKSALNINLHQTKGYFVFVTLAAQMENPCSFFQLGSTDKVLINGGGSRDPCCSK